MADLYLFFGDTGTGKTTEVGRCARYVYERTGKKTRYICSDNGGYKPIMPEVKAGIIEPFHVGTLPNILPVMRKLTIGWWPQQLQDGRMVGGTIVAPGPDTWKEVGAYAWEGLTSTCELINEDLRTKQRSIGQDAVGKFEEEGEKFAANSQTHYGFSQREGFAMLKRFGALPVEKVFITAHEAKGEDTDTRQAIRGPALVGSAGTDKVGKEVGALLHIEQYIDDVKVANADKSVTTVKRSKMKAHFESHADPKFEAIIYKCKPRVPLSLKAKLLEKWPGGFVELTPTEGLDSFLRFEDELLVAGLDDISKWKKEVDAARAKG